MGLSAYEQKVQKKLGASLDPVDKAIASAYKDYWGGQALEEHFFKPGSALSLTQIYDKYLSKRFQKIAGDAADRKARKIAERLPRYVYSPSTYRRSFRTVEAAPYAQKFRGLVDWLFFPWETYDPVSLILKATDEDEDEDEDDDEANGEKDKFPLQLASDLIALEIDEGNRAVIDAVKEVCLGDNNTGTLSYGVINAITKCENEELHDLLTGLLLAAKLQEGLRQAILENADNGRVDVFVKIMKTVLDNDLLRYSSAQRAVLTWMGLGYDAVDRRQIDKLLDLGYRYVTDARARAEAYGSTDVLAVYCALWADSTYAAEHVIPVIEELLGREKHICLTALFFTHQLEWSVFKSDIGERVLGSEDLDVLAFAIGLLGYRVSAWGEKEDYFKTCKDNSLLSQRNRARRDELFAKLLAAVPRIPEKGYVASGKPFAWCSAELKRRDVLTQAMAFAGFDRDKGKIAALLDVLPLADADTRADYMKFFLDGPAAGTKARAALVSGLSDRSMAVRRQALKNLKELPLEPQEADAVIDLLALKTGDLRQNAVEILLGLPGDGASSAVKKLIADRNGNKRLAALDMMLQLVRGERLSKEDAQAWLALAPAEPSADEALLIGQISGPAAVSETYRSENGYGLYDPDYFPAIEVSALDKETLLEGKDTVFRFSKKRVVDLFAKLCARIVENKDFAYQTEYWDGSKQDVVLGASRYVNYPGKDTRSKEGRTVDDFVLPDVWRGWFRDDGVAYGDLFAILYSTETRSAGWGREHLPWAQKLLDKHFASSEMDSLRDSLLKEEYCYIAREIAKLLLQEVPEAERFRALYGTLRYLCRTIPESDWGRVCEEADKSRYRSVDKLNAFAECAAVTPLLRELSLAVKDDERFKAFLSAAFDLAKTSGCDVFADERHLARGVEMGVLKEDALFRAMLDPENGYLKQYTASNARRRAYHQDAAKEHPVLADTARATAARVIEIELGRGDTATEVSKLAMAVGEHEGAANFADILVAMGRETFVRGWVWTSNYTKKGVFSSLLKASCPAENDSAETLRAALGGRVTEQRLLEAVMYVPSWLPIVSRLLGWEGLESASWYFHAHVSERFSAEKETEVARYSPVTPEDFNDGAFDVAWFREAYRTLGEERFEILYDCAKYISSGAVHRRAQLFADAVLGKLDKQTLAAEIRSKRGQDKLRSYGLLPLAGDRDADLLERYEFIQQFLKESKKFGSQRRASEAKTSGIALDNLARNAGFRDSQRFAWRMETLKVGAIASYFEPAAVAGYQVCCEVNEDGSAAVIIEKDGKRLKSVPTAIKKDPYLIECKEVASSLKEQYRRARASLENAMVAGDVFAVGEIRALTEHPVISPLLAKLLFVLDGGRATDASAGLGDAPQVDVFGAFSEMADETEVRIAHCHDLYRSGKWHDFQRGAFENKLVQPFKQIFRELYLINEDERTERTRSRRYAGHQVQPRKTVALLKGRGWTVDYEEGLQRVYYKENIIAEMYAAADWFSPSDIEAPTLEYVQFRDRKTGEPIPVDAIPPLVFSEVMRDVDLVVSVAHVGGVDPEASLSTIEMRAVIVAELLRLLKIENAEIDGRFVKITGSLGEYRVHLGSGGVQMMGKGAINILAVPSQHRGRVFLPFADDDPRTAEILSKSIMLAEDRKIKDPFILDQLK